jgi:hypothetical protein
MFVFCSVYLCGFEKNSDGLISRSSSSLTPREPIVIEPIRRASMLVRITKEKHPIDELSPAQPFGP